MSRRLQSLVLVAQPSEPLEDTSAPARSSRGRVAGCALGVVVALTVLATAGVASAQRATSPSGVPSGPGVWTITPSLAVGEKYTDNLFGTAHDHQSDFITQITPGLGLSYETTSFKLSVGYTVTGEIYADNSDLDNFGDNQTGTLALDYRPDERWHFNLTGYYARTNDPSQFLVSTAVPAGTVVVPTVETTRRQTDQVTLSAGADYQFTQRLTGRAGYVFSYLKQEGVEDSYSNTGSLGADYQLTRLDTGLATVSVSVLEPNTDTSGSLLLGWRRQWTPDFTTSVAAGPRVTNSTWGGAADASANYQATREWSLRLAYSLGTGLVAGATGAQNVSALTASVGYQPLRDLRFSVDGGWTRTWGIEGSSDSEDAYGVGASASYQITTWLTVSLSYRYAIEEPTKGDSIRTNQVLLVLTAAYPWVLPR